MRSVDAFRVFTNETRPMEENTTWSAPTISRLFELADDTGRGTGKFVGHSVEHRGHEDFFKTDGQKLGHTVKDIQDMRTFYDADGHKIGHEVEGGMFHAEPRHVHVHAARQRIRASVSVSR